VTPLRCESRAHKDMSLWVSMSHKDMLTPVSMPPGMLTPNPDGGNRRLTRGWCVAGPPHHWWRERRSQAVLSPNQDREKQYTDTIQK